MAAPAKPQRGWYVYGIVPQDVEVEDGAQGVGDPPAGVELVRNGDIAAMVSEIDCSKPLGRPEDLVAHQRLLDAAASEAPVLPVRFGAVMNDQEAVADELLRANHDEFKAALTELEGQAEYIVKGRYVEEVILREVLDENPEAARVNDQIRSKGGSDATRDLKIQLGEMINEALTAKREADTRVLGDALASVVAASEVQDPTHEEDAANVAVLVEMAKQGDLERAIGDISKKWQGRVEMRLLGPMAPYDFVVTAPPEG